MGDFELFAFKGVILSNLKKSLPEAKLNLPRGKTKTILN